MRQFTSKDMTIESETALAMIEQQKQAAKRYSRYVGLDVHKDTIAVAIAPGDGGSVRYYGEIPNTHKAINKMMQKLSPEGEVLACCYEAGPCGYGLRSMGSFNRSMGSDSIVFPLSDTLAL